MRKLADAMYSCTHCGIIITLAEMHASPDNGEVLLRCKCGSFAFEVLYVEE